MKGVIADCLRKLVINKFGKDKWEESLGAVGFPGHKAFLATDDVPDADVLKLVDSVCNVLNITMQQAADAFGDYWVNDYAPKIYKMFYRDITCAKDFILNMDNVHEMVTQSMPNAHPPRFLYDWDNDTDLIITYQSKRGLIDFLIGLIKGVGSYYKETLQVTKLSGEKVKVVFK